MARILRNATQRNATQRNATHKYILRHLDKRGVRAADTIHNPLRRAANAFCKGL